jgi:hypothetical protein
MDATSRPYDGVDPGRTEESTEPGNEHESDADANASQQDEDARRQKELTRSVSIRLTRAEKPTSRRWRRLRGLGRNAVGRDTGIQAEERAPNSSGRTS